MSNSITATIEEVRNIALSDVGYKEGKNNSNKFASLVTSKDGKKAPNNAPYCGIGAFSAWARAGVPLAHYFTTPWYVPGIWAQAKREGWSGSKPDSDMDLVIYDWQGDSTDGDHVGLALPSKGTGHAIEYNTSKGTGGSQGNGDGVYERTRKANVIIGYVHVRKILTDVFIGATPGEYISRGPNLRKGDRGPQVMEVQNLLRAAGADIAADGIYGPRTTTAVRDAQRAYGLDIDGVVGPKTLLALKSGKTPVRQKLRKGSNGGDVPEIQSLVGVRPDGKFGPDTEKAVKSAQRSRGLSADGVVGPDTWSALMGVRITCS